MSTLLKNLGENQGKTTLALCQGPQKLRKTGLRWRCERVWQAFAFLGVDAIVRDDRGRDWSYPLDGLEAFCKKIYGAKAQSVFVDWAREISASTREALGCGGLWEAFSEVNRA